MDFGNFNSDIFQNIKIHERYVRNVVNPNLGRVCFGVGGAGGGQLPSV